MPELDTYSSSSIEELAIEDQDAASLQHVQNGGGYGDSVAFDMKFSPSEILGDVPDSIVRDHVCSTIDKYL